MLKSDRVWMEWGCSEKVNENSSNKFCNAQLTQCCPACFGRTISGWLLADSADICTCFHWWQFSPLILMLCGQLPSILSTMLLHTQVSSWCSQEMSRACMQMALMFSPSQSSWRSSGSLWIIVWSCRWPQTEDFYGKFQRYQCDGADMPAWHPSLLCQHWHSQGATEVFYSANRAPLFPLTSTCDGRPTVQHQVYYRPVDWTGAFFMLIL